MTARPAPYCVTEVGDIRLTYLPDGEIHTSPKDLYAGETAQLWDSNDDLLDERGFMVMSVGSVLIQTAGKNVLVDLGYGPLEIDIDEFTDGAYQGSIKSGNLLTSLANWGLQPTDIDAVLFSHLHNDHIGWIADGGEPTFVNATHYINELEWKHWNDAPSTSPAAPTAEQLAILGSRLTLLPDGAIPAPGIHALLTPGHTPGHVAFVVASGRHRAVVLGDAIHSPLEVTHDDLEWADEFDAEMSRQTRAMLRRELGLPDTIAASAHFPNRVFGRLRMHEGTAHLDFVPTQVPAAACLPSLTS